MKGAEAGGDHHLPLQPTLGRARGCQAIAKECQAMAQQHQQVFAA